MRQLSTVLEPMQPIANAQEQKQNLLHMLQRGLTSADGKTITPAWTLGQVARDYTITPESVDSLLLRLRQIKSCLKRVDSWIETPPYGHTLKVSYEWVFPEDFDHATAQSLIQEASRPCGGATIKYFLALARTKKIENMGVNDAERYLMTYIRDLSEFCELAVIAALNDIRLNNESPWFPTIAEIRKAAAEYHDSIIRAQEYFRRNDLTRINTEKELIKINARGG